MSVPAAIDQPQIVVNTGPNQVTFDEFNRWASPLQDNIARVVAENLVAILGTPRVTLFPLTLDANPDFRVQIGVRNFESVTGKSASLDAVWTVRRAKDGKSETGRTSARRSWASCAAGSDEVRSVGAAAEIHPDYRPARFLFRNSTASRTISRERGSPS